MTELIDWWFLYVNSKCHEENKPEFLSSKAESIPYFINYQFEITPIFWVDVSQFSNRLVIVVRRNSDLKLGISFLVEHLILGLMFISCTVCLKNFLFFMESMVCVEIPEQFKWPHSLFGNLDAYQTHGHHQMGSCSIMVILLMKNSG